MSKKNKNPYRDGSKYHAIFAEIQSKQVVTRNDLGNFSTHDVTVVLSPRATSTRGDCRGNISSQGHLYFIEPIAKKADSDKRYRLRWRKEPLEARKRTGKTEVAAEKTKATQKQTVDA